MTRRRVYEVPIDGPGSKDREVGDETGTTADPAETTDDARSIAPELSSDQATGDPPGADESLDHLKRLQAEFANYRRRTERERLETVGWAQSVLVERLLPVLDDFERAAAAAGDGGVPEVQGLRLVGEKLRSILTEAGLERIQAEGEHFDPDQHEALMTQPVSAEMAGKVVAEIEPGYRFKGKLLRPARVQVGVDEESG